MEVARYKNGVGEGEERTFRQAGFSDKERGFGMGKMKKTMTPTSHMSGLWQLLSSLNCDL